jgi:hypothetical protein
MANIKEVLNSLNKIMTKVINFVHSKHQTNNQRDIGPGAQIKTGINCGDESKAPLIGCGPWTLLHSYAL